MDLYDMKQYKHIIWDWNGTLLNDVWLAVDVMNSILLARKMPGITTASYRRVFDFPVKNYYQKLGFDFNKESFEKIGTEFIGAYDKRHLECKLHNNTLDVIAHLHTQGRNQSILSARKHEELLCGIKNFGLQRYIPVQSGLHDHYANGKIELGKKHFERIDESPENVVMIGDTTHDYETAKTLGIDCILLSHGHQHRKRLEKCKVRIFDNIMDIIPFI